VKGILAFNESESKGVEKAKFNFKLLCALETQQNNKQQINHQTFTTTENNLKFKD
jgi:hypothetical protein